MLFKNATIYTMEQDPFVGDFRIDKGVFTEVGTNLTANEGEDVQDLNGLFVFPGLVESHCHLGMEETAIRFEGTIISIHYFIECTIFIHYGISLKNNIIISTFQ